MSTHNNPMLPSDYPKGYIPTYDGGEPHRPQQIVPYDPKAPIYSTQSGKFLAYGAVKYGTIIDAPGHKDHGKPYHATTLDSRGHRMAHYAAPPPTYPVLSNKQMNTGFYVPSEHYDSGYSNSNYSSYGGNYYSSGNSYSSSSSSTSSTCGAFYGYTG
jgi:hypothetical protein